MRFLRYDAFQFFTLIILGKFTENLLKNFVFFFKRQIFWTKILGDYSGGFESTRFLKCPNLFIKEFLIIKYSVFVDDYLFFLLLS